jgi:uncharacterized protein YgiM (DUF1202 family)
MARLRTIAFTAAILVSLAVPAAAFFFATSDHALRTGPGDQARVAGAVAEGQRLAVIDCKADWCLVAAGRKTGWLEGRFIGVAADSAPSQPGLPIVQLPPTWRWRHGPLDLPDPPLGPPRPPLAEPELHLQ